MVEPMWQYITLFVFFSLGAVLNWASVILILFSGSVDLKEIKIKNPRMGSSMLFFRTIVAVFAAYLSYSLYTWHPSGLSLFIVVVHWSSVFSVYITDFFKAGETRTCTFGQFIFGAGYTSVVISALCLYGSRFL